VCERFGDISITPVVASWHGPRDCFSRRPGRPPRYSNAHEHSRQDVLPDVSQRLDEEGLDQERWGDRRRDRGGKLG
jgi:hypothetical protein